MTDPSSDKNSFRDNKKLWNEDALEGTKERPRQERVLVLLMSGIILGIVIAGLWVTLGAAAENVRQSQALQQIIDIIYATREISSQDQNFESQGRDDLLKVLEERQLIKTNAELNGVKVMANPWGNAMVAVAIRENRFRLETIVPPHACKRIIDFFGNSNQSLGVDVIEVKGWNNAWRQIYNKANAEKISDGAVIAGCKDTVAADVALIFELR